MRTVLSKDGTPIAFDQSGQGPALILVAPATATRLAQAALAATLAPHFTVYAYDRRGRGDSGDTAPYAVEREIEDIDALITAAGGSAFVFGHSSGATLTLYAALQIPLTRLPMLAIYEPPMRTAPHHAHLPEDYVTHLNELIANNQRSDAVAYFMTAAIGMPPEAV